MRRCEGNGLIQLFKFFDRIGKRNDKTIPSILKKTNMYGINNQPIGRMQIMFGEYLCKNPHPTQRLIVELAYYYYF